MKKLVLWTAVGIALPVIIAVLIGVFQAISIKANNKRVAILADQATSKEIQGRPVTEAQEFEIWSRNFDQIHTERGPANE
jgi:hypothetical protein